MTDPTLDVSDWEMLIQEKELYKNEMIRLTNEAKALKATFKNPNMLKVGDKPAESWRRSAIFWADEFGRVNAKLNRSSG